MSYHGPSYGLSKELQDKREASYDKVLERDVISWIESMTGTRCNGSLHDYLRTGVVLCELINHFKPGTCRINKSTMPFKIMENISSFLSACSKFGISDSDMFQTVDLYEAKNMSQVLQTLSTLRRITGCGTSAPVANQVPLFEGSKNQGSSNAPSYGTSASSSSSYSSRSTSSASSSPSYARKSPVTSYSASPKPVTSSPKTAPRSSPQPAHAGAGPKFCTQCGTKTVPGARFCGECGNKLI